MANARARVGEAELVALVDAVPGPVDPSWSFPAVPAEAWGGHAPGSLDADGRFHPNLGCFLLRLHGRLVLVDTGIGPGPNAYLKGLTGSLPARLADEGVSFADIGLVVFTHLHIDHVGWAATEAGDPAFPNARYVAPAAELDWWMHRSAGAGAHHLDALHRSIRPLAGRGLIEALPENAAIADGLAYLSTPGHTPGHASVRIDSGGAVGVIAGDIFHCPAQVAMPDWGHRADHDPATARRTRRAFIADAAAGSWLVAAGHFRDGWNFGRIAGPAGERRWVPVAA